MTASEEHLMPISRLFYDDAGPHIVGLTTAPTDLRGTLFAPPAVSTAKYTPARGRDLHDLLGTSIAQLGGVSGGTRRTPVSSPAVPIDALLYRGRAALERALEIRATVRAPGQALTNEAVDELLDLIGLAAED